MTLRHVFQREVFESQEPSRGAFQTEGVKGLGRDAKFRQLLQRRPDCWFPTGRKSKYIFFSQHELFFKVWQTVGPFQINLCLIRLEQHERSGHAAVKDGASSPFVGLFASTWSCLLGLPNQASCVQTELGLAQIGNPQNGGSLRSTTSPKSLLRPCPPFLGGSRL